MRNSELGFAETCLNERALCRWDPMAVPAGVCWAAWVTTGLKCVLLLHSVAAKALIKQYQTCPSKTMGDFTCLSFLAANFPCSSFFLRSTLLGAIFLTSLHAAAIIFNRPLSQASLLHVRLLPLCYHGHTKQTRSTKAVAAQYLELQSFVCRKRKTHTANRLGWSNGKRIPNPLVESTVLILKPAML